jgi:hypothetical protein
MLHISACYGSLKKEAGGVPTQRVKASSFNELLRSTVTHIGIGDNAQK